MLFDRFHRPAFQDKEHLLADYCLPLTFHLLSTDNLLTFITACLLEKRIVVYSSHVRFLSAVVYVAPYPPSHLCSFSTSNRD